MEQELKNTTRLLGDVEWISLRFARAELRKISEADQSLQFHFSVGRAGGRLVLVCKGIMEDSSLPLEGIVGDICLAQGSFVSARARWMTDERCCSLPLRVLIAPRGNTVFEVSARLLTSAGWRDIDHVFLESAPGSSVWQRGCEPAFPEAPPERVQRFTSSFGEEAWQRLRRSTAVVIGAGGTGSAAIPTLARAGVGRIIIVDSDHITSSNLERTHASFPEHVETKTLKAELARNHVRQIDPDIDVIAYEGRLPQPEIVAEVMRADVVLGCTDQQTSRLALADIARRYLVPAIDCGGLIEGANGHVTGQVIQLVVFGPDAPCPICRGMIDPIRVAQELLSSEERAAIQNRSAATSLPPQAQEVPQIDTVGYITTVSGTLAAGYAIGWMTGRFDPPFERMQMNLVEDCLDVTNRPQKHAESCDCQASRGLADSGSSRAPFSIPQHWKPARRL